MRGLFRGIRRALATPLGPVQGPRGGSLQGDRIILKVLPSL